MIGKLIAAFAVVAAALGRRPSSPDQSGSAGVDALGEPSGTGANAPDEGLPPDTGYLDADDAPSPLVQRIDEFQKQSRPVGFCWAVLKKFGEDKAGLLAALVAYFGFFSIFPLLIALVSVLGFVLEDNPDLRSDIADTAFDQIPIVGNTLANTIDDIEGSGILLLIGILISLWAGLRVIDAIQNALNDIWDLPRSRKVTFVKRRARGVLTLVVLFLGLVGGAAINALAQLLPDLPGAGRTLIMVATIALNMGLFVVLFRIMTAERLPWKAHVTGGVLGGFFWWGMQNFGVVYLARVEESAGPTYGSFASTIVLLTFIFISAQLISLAAEVGVVRYRGLWPRAMPKCTITDADRRAWQLQAEQARQVPAQRITSQV
ncbi:MAG: YihY/virulence factor BrkB family protein [Actinomycetota bacterium]